MIHPCDKPCGNKSASGYCATTACINPMYSNIGTVQYGQGVQKRIVTNTDRIRGMSDEELAEWISEYTDCLCGIHKPGCSKTKGTCVATWLDWLKQEADDGQTP